MTPRLPERVAGRDDQEMSDLGLGWDAGINLDPWDFDFDFWENLAAHPTLASCDDQITGA